jgi:DNA-binding response OmpR family regulator
MYCEKAHSMPGSLQSDELEVVVAATGRQGIELVEQTRPDAVILDVRLSDMSGLDGVTAKAAHQHGALPCIGIGICD